MGLKSIKWKTIAKYAAIALLALAGYPVSELIRGNLPI